MHRACKLSETSELHAHGLRAENGSPGTRACEQRGQVLCDPGTNSLLLRAGAEGRVIETRGALSETTVDLYTVDNQCYFTLCLQT